MPTNAQIEGREENNVNAMGNIKFPSFIDLPECGEYNSLYTHKLANGMQGLELFLENAVEQDQAKNGNHLRKVVGQGHIGPGEFKVDLTLIVHVEYLRDAKILNRMVSFLWSAIEIE